MKTARQKASVHQHDTSASLRESIDGSGIVDNIKALLREVDDIKTQVRTARSTRTNPTGVKDARVKASQMLRIIELQLNTNFRLLMKILPDLRSADGKEDDSGFVMQLRDAIMGVTRDRNEAENITQRH